MRLYNYWRSTSSWRVRIALALKRLPYEYVPVHLLRDGGEQHRAAYREKNLMAEVPTLELDDGTLLRQSLAIIAYLDEQHPAPPLLPQEAVLRARVREISEIVNSGIQPQHNLAVLKRLREANVDEKAWARHFIRNGLVAIEAIVRQWGAGRYLAGDAVSLADVCVVPQIYSARRYDVDLTECPLLVQIADRVAGEPAFSDTHPDRQSDANKP